MTSLFTIPESLLLAFQSKTIKNLYIKLSFFVLQLINISHQGSNSNFHLNIIDEMWLSMWMLNYINSLWMTDEWNATHCLWLGFLLFLVHATENPLDEPEGVRQTAGGLQNQNPLSSCISGIPQKPNKSRDSCTSYPLTGLPKSSFLPPCGSKKLQPVFFTTIHTSQVPVI